MSFGVKNSDMKEGQAAFMHLYISSISFCKFLQIFAVDCKLTRLSQEIFE